MVDAARRHVAVQVWGKGRGISRIVIRAEVGFKAMDEIQLLS